MNRRTAVLGIFGIATIVFAGFKFWKIFRKPDLNYLDTKKGLIGEIADTIIPATDTPGAKDVGVEDFILKMVKECTEKKSQNAFISGLKDLEDYTLKEFSKNYFDCNGRERIDILTHLENKEELSPIVHKISKRLFGDSFMYQFKYYAIMGYCTSEAGSTKAMAYDYIPGTYQACIPLTPHQKCWATQ
ncbi:gluconate 2-dehydrogenase subunit 3 family protein [Pedobacter nyackensis]|uniref:gluconate 2-dehydrogenase subunit 3 family protein n=1 Tax=Pedobacter nyackensis TaxID=475255 RepID=UPI00292EF75E|nr:gluconate 2-dehydrogenase subunit 3 family protein [Pedobacter nyackensis]